MAFGFGDIAADLAENSEVKGEAGLESVELLGDGFGEVELRDNIEFDKMETGSDDTIIGDGLGEEALVNEKTIEVGEVSDISLPESTENIGDGVSDTGMEDFVERLSIDGTPKELQNTQDIYVNRLSSRARDTKERESLDQVVKNKLDGCEREEEVETELEEKYPCPPNEIIREAYLRDENGIIVRDPITGTARRVDFVVVRDGEVIDSVEVTSQTAPKEEQMAKETRIRENGGIYVRTEDGTLAKYPTNVTTRIERKD